MTEAFQTGLMGAASALLGGAITGGLTYLSAIRQREAERHKRRLLRAYQDITAFYRLEELYSGELATAARSAEAVKRDIRRRLRESGVESPSEDATPQQCTRRAQELA